MKREFQIRVENVRDDNDVIDVLCYTSLAEANDAYNRMLRDETEEQEYQLELIEVLRQDTIRTEVDTNAVNFFACKGGVS